MSKRNHGSLPAADLLSGTSTTHAPENSQPLETTQTDSQPDLSATSDAETNPTLDETLPVPPENPITEETPLDETPAPSVPEETPPAPQAEPETEPAKKPEPEPEKPRKELDRSKPFAQIIGSDDGAVYEQDYLHFDAAGMEMVTK